MIPLLLTACIGVGCSKPSPGHGSLVLISIDTLRADHLGLYGYRRDTSPNIDDFFESALIFENAFSTSQKTTESHMSMFTAVYPSVHRCETSLTADHIGVLSDGILTLAEILSGAGYRTAGFHGGGNVSGRIGFKKGFDLYEKAEIDAAVAWIREHQGERFFLFFHTYHVHDPYTPKPPFDTLYDPDYAGRIESDLEILAASVGAAPGEWNRIHKAYWGRVTRSDPKDIRHLEALYDGEINEMDLMLKGLFETVEACVPGATVVFLSDHGEEFGEHGGLLHEQIYNELIRVPLMIRSPDLDGRRVEARVSLVGLTPTLLQVLGVSIETDQFQGRSFLDVERDEAIFSELPLFNMRSLIQDGKKRILTPRSKELYDLEFDPFESFNIHHRQPKLLLKAVNRVARQNRGLAELLNQGERKRVEMDPESLRELQELGYIK